MLEIMLVQLLWSMRRSWSRKRLEELWNFWESLSWSYFRAVYRPVHVKNPHMYPLAL